MMSKNGTGTADPQAWVEVAVEPDHKEIFRNEQVRVYIAFIRPGEETLYHRHDKDTLYVVLDGGKNYSSTLPGTREGKYVLPKSISLGQKIRWLFTRSMYGWTNLPKSAYVLMHNEGNPVIHKVRGSEDNPAAMRMMGIEFLQPGGRQTARPMGTQSLPVDYEDDTVRVFRLKLPSDLEHLKESLCFTGMVVALEGMVRIEAAPAGSAQGLPRDLKEGGFLWNNGGTQLTLAAPDGSESEALVITM
jgi:hypothetical protein